MKYRLGAAFAAVLTVVAAGSVEASPPNWVVATSFDGNTSTLGGLDQHWASWMLRHTDTTTHLPGVLTHGPGQLPPDPCRGVVTVWNVFVGLEQAGHLHHSEARFSSLLNHAAQHNCTVSFTPGSTNTDGSVNLISVAPGQ